MSELDGSSTKIDRLRVFSSPALSVARTFLIPLSRDEGRLRRDRAKISFVASLHPFCHSSFLAQLPLPTAPDPELRGKPFRTWLISHSIANIGLKVSES